MTELRTLTGRYGELEPHAPDWEGSGAQWLPVSYATYGWHHLQAGEIDEAKALFHQVRPLLRALPVNARWMATVFRAGELAVAFDDTETVEIAYRLLLPYERYFAGQSAAYLGAIPRALGEHGKRPAPTWMRRIGTAPRLSPWRPASGRCPSRRWPRSHTPAACWSEAGQATGFVREAYSIGVWPPPAAWTCARRRRRPRGCWPRAAG